MDKVWVVVGVLKGVIDSVRVFSNEGDADIALAEADRVLGIERDDDGRYESENDAGVYEADVEPPTM